MTNANITVELKYCECKIVKFFTKFRRGSCSWYRTVTKKTCYSCGLTAQTIENRPNAKCIEHGTRH
jgi:hypothetical protein